MKKLLRMLVIALALVGVLVIPALAKRPSGAGAGKAPLYDSAPCDCNKGATVTSGPAYGFVVLNTNGEPGESKDVTGTVSIKRGTANVTYHVFLNQQPGGLCESGSSDKVFGPVLTTNRQGNGNFHFKVAELPARSIFWVSACESPVCDSSVGQVLRSTAVTLD